MDSLTIKRQLYEFQSWALGNATLKVFADDLAKLRGLVDGYFLRPSNQAYLAIIEELRDLENVVITNPTEQQRRDLQTWMDNVSSLLLAFNQVPVQQTGQSWANLATIGLIGLIAMQVD